jgi:hypothetical protein
MEVEEWVDSEGYPDDEGDPDSDITVVLVSRSECDKRAHILSHIDEIAHLKGLAKGLEEVSWIEVTEDGVKFKRAARHNTETAKRRAVAARRQQRHRASRRSSDTSRSKRDQRREEKSSNRESVSIEEGKPHTRAFSEPTIEDVAAYCTERKNGIDPEAFVAFYASKGWVVGKSPMKNWKQAIITWEKSRKRDTVRPASKVLEPEEFDSWTPE